MTGKYEFTGDNDYAKQYRAAVDLALMIVRPREIEEANR